MFTLGLVKWALGNNQRQVEFFDLMKRGPKKVCFEF